MSSCTIDLRYHIINIAEPGFCNHRAAPAALRKQAIICDMSIAACTQRPTPRLWLPVLFFYQPFAAALLLLATALLMLAEMLLSRAQAHLDIGGNPGAQALPRVPVDPRDCYALSSMKVIKRLSIRIAKAKKCKPAKVSGKRS